MDNNKLKQLLEEIYALDGSLRARENELIKAIEGYMAIKDEIVPDETFKQNLLRDIRSRFPSSQSSISTLFPGFSIMNKLTYGLGGAALVFALVIGYNYVGNGLSVDYGSKVTVSQVGENAFGSLSDVNSVNNNAVSGRGAGSNLANPMAAPEADNSVTTAASVARPQSGGGGVGGDPSIDAKMAIWPGYTQYVYVYKGEPVEITEDKVNVLQRVTGSAIASQLNKLVGRLGFDFINLKSFNNLTVQNITLAEEKDLGYIINISGYDGTVSLYENWMRWTSAYPTTEVQPLRPSDIPADSEIINIANQFINEHDINVTSYGTPEVIKNFYGPRPLAEADTQLYIPDAVQVVYPLLIDGKKVYENGQPAGISLNINVRVKRVSSVNGISVNRYDSSAYATEQDFNKILEVAKRGGQWGWYGDPASSYMPAPSEEVKTVEVELGAPTMEYVKIWKYDASGQMPKELIVPALVFPVVNPPQDGMFYQTSITVPIVKDLLNMNNGGVMPMIKG